MLPTRGERLLSRPADFGARRALVIPAAGTGSRLRSTFPKVLVPIAGRPMIDWLVDLYAPWVERFIIIASPAFRTALTEHVALHGFASAASIGEGTGERNFLPFIPWAEMRGGVITYACEDELESTGVNTPEELALVERYLRRRS